MFKNHLKSEKLKITSNRWMILSMTILMLFVPSMVIVLDSLVSNIGIEYYGSKLLQSFYLAQVFFVVISVLYFGQEFSSKTIRTTVLSSPNRLYFLTIKLLALLVLTVILLVLSTLFSVIIIGVGLKPDFNFAEMVYLLKVLVPAYVATIQLCILSASIVVISKSVIVSLGIVLPMILGLGQLLLQFNSLLCILPVLSAMNAFLLSANNVYLPLVVGLMSQSMWCLLLFMVSLYSFKYRAIR